MELLYYESDTMNPYFNLATEEYLLKTCGEEQKILFLWQNRNTVVIGRNQNAWKECKVEKIERDGGHLARRLSGGGAVYHDSGNLNFTFIAPKQHHDVAANMEILRRAVVSFGIDAKATGRNDLEADGYKFSGNAYYEGAKTCYHHGTLMIDVDVSKLSEYLQVSEAKLKSKGVDSVRSRVRNLKSISPGLDVEKMKAAVRGAFSEFAGDFEGQFLSGETFSREEESSFRAETAGMREKGNAEREVCREITLDEKDREEISYLAEKYASWDWVFGRRIAFQREWIHRFAWGEVSLQFQVNGGIVQDVLMYSDALYGNLPEKLPLCLKGKRYEREEILQALQACAQRDLAGEESGETEVQEDSCSERQMLSDLVKCWESCSV